MAEPAFTQFSYPSANGKDTVAAYLWMPDAPRAVVQISHGMQEYTQRF